MQNRIRELFSLLYFVEPTKYKNLDELQEMYSELDKERISDIHEMLKPHFLRRTKAEALSVKLPPKAEIVVPVSMTTLQRTLYKSVLEGNHELLLSLGISRHGGAPKTKVSLLNVLMELRKIVNHPYLIPYVEQEFESDTDTLKYMIESSGKLTLLHRMLTKLKENGHRVLLFSQMTHVLDLIEDYCNMTKIKYARIDGSMNMDRKQASLDAYNAPNSNIFLMLLSTRSGGQGINLTTADTVIIYDCDFNPHVDMQACARCHRIGQTKKVLIVKFVTKNSAEGR